MAARRRSPPTSIGRSPTARSAQSDIYMGESYDARRELPGWDLRATTTALVAGEVFADTGAALVATNGPKVRRQELRPREVREIPPSRGRAGSSTWARTWSAGCGSRSSGPAVNDGDAALRRGARPGGRALHGPTCARPRSTVHYTLKGEARRSRSRASRSTASAMSR